MKNTKPLPPPRNPLVAPLMRRHAGPHAKSTKQERRKLVVRLAKQINSESERV